MNYLGYDLFAVLSRTYLRCSKLKKIFISVTSTMRGGTHISGGGGAFLVIR